MPTCWAQEKALDILREMVSAESNLIEGCRELVRLFPHLPSEVTAGEDARTIVGVESETDSLPIGQERRHWAERALEQADAELAEYLDQVRNPLVAACRGLLRQLDEWQRRDSPYDQS